MDRHPSEQPQTTLKPEKENRHHADLSTQNPAGVEPKAARKPRPKVRRLLHPWPALFIGLDVHNESISLAPSDSTEVRRHGIIGDSHDDVLKVANKLQAAHPGLSVEALLRAGPHG
jgi:hypothetical protein